MRRKNSLPVAIMPELRYRKWKLLQVALFPFAVNANDAVGFRKRQTAEKKILYQTEDRCVHADADGERDYSKRSKSG